MDHASEPEWEQLKRREELRKAETSLGGRQRYVSPLELFRMQLDAEAVKRSTAPSGEAHLQESHSQSSENRQQASTVQPPSPDDVESVHHRSARSLSEADMEERIQEEPPLMEVASTLNKESWLRSVFPFKQRRKLLKINKQIDHMDIATISKDTCFRNPLYKAKSKGTKQDHVEVSSVSLSHKSQTRIGKLKAVENSDGSKRITTAVSYSMCDRTKSGDGTQCSRHAPDQFDSCMGEPDFGNLLGIYTRAGKFPLGRCQSSSSSPVKRGYSSLGAIRKALIRSRMQSDDARGTITIGDQMPSGRYAGPKKDRKYDSGNNETCLGSCVQRKKNHQAKSASPVPAGSMGRAPCSKGVRMGDASRSKTPGCSRSARVAEDGDQGFTAFVPFQGFDVFVNQNVGRSEGLCQQSVGSISSTDESRNSGSRHSAYSKNSDRIYRRK